MALKWENLCSDFVDLSMISANKRCPKMQLVLRNGLLSVKDKQDIVK